MRKLLKIFGVLLLLVLAWLGLILSEWLPRPTEDELAAMALLKPEPASIAGDRNAFAATWLFGYDVPEAELEKVAAADAATFLAAAKLSGQVTDFKSTADGKYPGVPSPPSNDPLLCENWGSGCLARVRANPEASRARVAEFAKRLNHSDRLSKYDHYRYGFLPRYDSPIGGGAAFQLQLTAAALDYLDGNVDAAFARVCRDTATWRRLRAHSDALIMDMLGVAQMSNATRLYAEMLGEQSVDFAPPCPETFAPLRDAEINQCASLRGEFLFSRNSFIDAVRTNAFAAHPRPRWYTETLARLINERHVVGLTASAFAPVCGKANRERVRRRDPEPLPFAVACDGLAWGFDPVGCAQFFESVPTYNDYYQRVLDLDARLKLLHSALWLRTQPLDGDRGSQFAARPAELQSAHHAMTFDAERSVLRMTNLQKSKGEYWELPYRTLAAASVGSPPDPVSAPASDGN